MEQEVKELKDAFMQLISAFKQTVDILKKENQELKDIIKQTYEHNLDRYRSGDNNGENRQP